MKKIITILAISALLSSCVPYESIIFKNDPYKNQSTLFLKLDVKSYASIKYGYILEPSYILKTTFIQERLTNGEDSIFLRISLRTGASTSKISKELYVATDRDTLILHGQDYVEKDYTKTTVKTESSSNDTNSINTNTSKETSSQVQLFSQTYPISKEVAQMIANSKKISFRFYFGNIGFDAKATPIQQDKIFKYFQKTMLSNSRLQTELEKK